MNPEAKSSIKRMVLQLRHILEEEIENRLKRYGYSNKNWRNPNELPHIQNDPQAKNNYFRLRNALQQHLRRINANPKNPTDEQRSEALDWFVREIAFTHLNRLVALKALEVRDLIPEIITTHEAYGGRSKAHYQYCNKNPMEAQQPDDALPKAIRSVCRGIYHEFKFLFDVGDPKTNQNPPANTLLWPSYPVLRNCIRLINGLDASAKNPGKSLWKEDEIIGWVYQFYNAEEKEEIRSRGRPELPAEVAVINQFFTPRWIIKYLVDNTLGRIWLEMHPDSQRVREKCDYIVPELLKDAVKVEENEDNIFFPDPTSPINNPLAKPRRKPKQPEDLHLIDPACGTMHFGHYAFEVFYLIYEEAIQKGWASFPEQGIAAAILENNLYGVDIDLRAVQLAGLSLFIKAKSMSPNIQIDHMNLVVANAVLPSDGARKTFLDQYSDDKVVQRAIRQVLEEMENVAEVGSLLRVEERLRGILGDAGHKAAKSLEENRRQSELPGLKKRERQLSLAETNGSNPKEWGAHYTITCLLRDLKLFAASAMKIHDLNAQLFAHEAEKTVHLLDVFLNEYDVVVMNPPYGSPTDAGKVYLDDVYPETKNDLYAAFIERSIDLLSFNGLVGAITSRTFLFLSRYEGLRRNIILNLAPLVNLIDLGFGVLDDALVETCAFVLNKNNDSKTKRESVFINLQNDQASLQKKLDEFLIAEIKRGQDIYLVRTHEFGLLPKSPFPYWVPNSLLNLYENCTNLEPAMGIVRAGVSTGNDNRFVRYIWEIHDNKSNWRTFSKGGSYSKYYYDFDLVINYSPEALAIMSNQGNKLANRDHYGKEGLTYPRVTVKGFNIRYFPPGSVFSDKGCCYFPNEKSDLWYMLGFLNSELVQSILFMFTPSRSFEVSHVGSLPIKRIREDSQLIISDIARDIYNIKSNWDTGNEISSIFKVPWVIQIFNYLSNHGTLKEIPIGKLINKLNNINNLPKQKFTYLKSLIDSCIQIEDFCDVLIDQMQNSLDEMIYDHYNILDNDKDAIKDKLGKQPPQIVWQEMERKSKKEKKKEHIRRLLSWIILEAIKDKADGILPLFETFNGETAIDTVRRKLEEVFGLEVAFNMEGEIKEILGRDIGDWLDGPFIKWHTKLYKNTPIIWQLSSDDYHNTFNCFIYYHKLNSDTLRKVQTQYLWPQKRAVKNKLVMAQKDLQDGVSGAKSLVEDAEKELGVLENFEASLENVINGQAPYKPPKWAEGPIRNGIYDPVIDDGIKVNLMPLQNARILRYKKMI